MHIPLRDDNAHVDWVQEPPKDGPVSVWSAQLAVLMDIREELARVRLVLECQNATEIPTTLSSILRILRAQVAAKRAAKK